MNLTSYTVIHFGSQDIALWKLFLVALILFADPVRLLGYSSSGSVSGACSASSFRFFPGRVSRMWAHRVRREGVFQGVEKGEKTKSRQVKWKARLLNQRKLQGEWSGASLRMFGGPPTRKSLHWQHTENMEHYNVSIRECPKCPLRQHSKESSVCKGKGKTTK